MTGMPGVGDVLHGFCGGAFGRDSYGCRRVEAVGFDWLVTRNDRREVELLTGEPLARLGDSGRDRSYCFDACEGPDPWEPNDIDMTGECCCAGCIGMGPCDLEPLGGDGIADDDLDDEGSN